MDTDFGQDLITITDEDGVEYELEILSSIEYQGSLYYALAPAQSDDDEELQVSILKAVDENGEEVLCAVEDEDELEQVYSQLLEQLYDDEDSETI